MITFSLWRPFCSLISFVPATGFSSLNTWYSLQTWVPCTSSSLPLTPRPSSVTPFGAQFRTCVLGVSPVWLSILAQRPAPPLCVWSERLIICLCDALISVCLPSQTINSLNFVRLCISSTDYAWGHMEGSWYVFIEWMRELESPASASVFSLTPCNMANRLQLCQGNILLPKMKGKLQNASAEKCKWERL